MKGIRREGECSQARGPPSLPIPSAGLTVHVRCDDAHCARVPRGVVDKIQHLPAPVARACPLTMVGSRGALAARAISERHEGGRSPWKRCRFFLSGETGGVAGAGPGEAGRAMGMAG